MRGGRCQVPVALALLLALGCTVPPQTPTEWTEQERALLLGFGPPPDQPPPSPENPWADDPAAAALGHALFFDPALSGSGAVSCASCHQPARRFTDGLPRSFGASRGTRNAPSLLGAAWERFLTSDGRKDSLWSHALEPLEDPAEHAFDRVGVVRHVALHHRAAFESIFGPLPEVEGLPAAARPVPGDPGHSHQLAWAALDAEVRAAIDRAFADVGRALEAYQRRLHPGLSPFDRFVAAVGAGDDGGGAHLEPAARRGLRAFLGPGQCVTCHGGPMLRDGAFHDLGLARDPAEGRAAGARRLLADPFRCGAFFGGPCEELRFLDPALPAFAAAFKTPSLRNVAETGPWFHAGQARTLAEAVDFYRLRTGSRVGQRAHLLELVDPAISTRDLVALLESFTGDPPDPRWTEPPPPCGAVAAAGPP